MDTLNPSNAKTTFAEGQRCKDILKPCKPCHVGIYWIALSEDSQMSTYVPGFRSFFIFFCIILYWQKLATSSKRVKNETVRCGIRISTNKMVF